MLRLSHVQSSAVHSSCTDQRYQVHQDNLVMPNKSLLVSVKAFDEWRLVGRLFLCSFFSKGLIRPPVCGVVLARYIHLLVKPCVKAAWVEWWPWMRGVPTCQPKRRPSVGHSSLWTSAFLWLILSTSFLTRWWPLGFFRIWIWLRLCILL